MTQLTFPFLSQGDEADELAHVLVAQVVNAIQALACPEFRWTEGADLKICRVRAAIAEDLRTRLKASELDHQAVADGLKGPPEPASSGKQ